MTRKTFDFGTTLRGTTFTLPNDLAGRRCAVFGLSGHGKSNTATVCIEGLVGNGEQVILIDPKGEAYGLKSSANGKHEGLDVVIFGQPYGDIEELDESHGDLIADFAVDTGRSIALSLLAFGSDESERRFVTRFMKRLFRRKTKQKRRSRVMVVMDEAQLFMPEGAGAGQRGEMAQLVGAIQRIALQGRTFGLGCMALAHRPQNVSKRVVSQAELLIVHNLSHNRDRKALQEWTDGFGDPEQQAELLATVAQLAPGEAWVWSPSWLRVFERVNVHYRSTFDSGATPDGSAASSPKARTPIDIDLLREKLSQLVEQAKGDDPKELHKKIRELERQLAKKDVAPRTNGDDIERSVQSAVRSRDKEWSLKLDEAKREISGLIKRMANAGTLLGKATAQLDLNGKIQIEAPAPQAPPILAAARDEQQKRRRIIAIDANPSSGGGDELRPAHRRLLNALAWLDVYGISTPQRSIVAAVAGVSPRSSSFTNDVSRLSSLGLIQYPQQGLVSLTSDGSEIAEAPNSPMTISDYHDSWRRCPALRPAHIRLLDVVIDEYPRGLTREELAERAGVSPRSSSFTNDVSRLSSLGLIHYPQQGHVAASELLFPAELLH